MFPYAGFFYFAYWRFKTLCVCSPKYIRKTYHVSAIEQLEAKLVIHAIFCCSLTEAIGSGGKGDCHANPYWDYICVLFKNMCIFIEEDLYVSSKDYKIVPSKDRICVFKIISVDYVCVQFHNCVCPIPGLCLCLSTVLSPLH